MTISLRRAPSPVALVAGCLAILLLVALGCGDVQHGARGRPPEVVGHPRASEFDHRAATSDRVAEQADAPASTSGALGRAGSTPAAVTSLVAALDALQARADRLLEQLDLVDAAAARLSRECVLGVAAWSYRAGEVSGRCAISPNVGVYRLPTEPSGLVVAAQ